ncbi:condensation domain-containing protein, partial [Denitromonas iodatirespirans]
MFINTLPVRLRIDERGVEAALRQTHETLARLLHHEHAPLALAQRCSGVDAQAPLFTSLLNYRYSPTNDKAANEPPEEHMDVLLSQDRTNYPIALSVDDLGEDFQLSAQVIEPLDATRMCRFMVRALDALLNKLDERTDAPLNSLDVLPAEERHQLLDDWNATAHGYDKRRSIHSLIEAQADAHPEALALMSAEE